ncbi:MAG: hypothetical protein MUD01_19725 [Chloroflexaceae bacterium]|nr:hypothetical protein [Chloroflexaceae bacterium]
MHRKQLTYCCLICLSALVLLGCSSPSTASARTALTEFYDLLNTGRYAEATTLYGGPFDDLRYKNGSVPPDDKSALIQSACTLQLRCLKVKQIVSDEQLSPVEWRFQVEFANPDGTTLTVGPCCGASPQDQPPRTIFEQRVRWTGTSYVVDTLGVAVP